MDNKSLEKFLPIGSVILLKGGEKRLMITGYCLITKQDVNKVYDYSGCLYPEGIITSEHTALFNHDQIEKVFCLGYSDEEDKEYRKKMLEEIKRQEQHNG